MLKHLYYPNILFPKRLALVKNITALALLASVISSWRLWTNQHFFPQVPLFSLGFSIPQPLDYVLFGAFILSVVSVLLFRKPRRLMLLTVFLGLVMIIFDQNRIQPWLVMYLLIFLILSLYNWRVDEPKKHVAVYTCLTVIIGSVYFWSGIQKLNPNFVDSTWQWFIQPLGNNIGADKLFVVKRFGYLVPFIEIFIGIGLFFGQTKRVAIPLAVAMHLLILIMLSPLFHNYNITVWPWNLAMILLVYILFAGNTESKYKRWTYLMEYKPLYFIGIITICLPALNLFNKWDSYLSSNLYSGNTTQLHIYVSGKAKSRLPYYIQYFTNKVGDDLYDIQIKSWALTELGVPGYPEPRVFEAIHKHIQEITCCENEVSFYMNEKESILKDV